jgi:hypothetical protein
MSTTPGYDLTNADPRGGSQMSDLLTEVLAAHGGLDEVVRIVVELRTAIL